MAHYNGRVHGRMPRPSAAQGRRITAEHSHALLGWARGTRSAYLKVFPW